MIKVSLIHNGWIAAHNGGNTVMRSLLDSQDLLREKGIEISHCTLDDIHPRNFNSTKSTKFKYNIRGVIKKIFDWLSNYFVFFTWLSYKLNSFSNSKLVVQRYINSNPSRKEVAFFHSVIPCYFYLIMRSYKQPTVLVMHTNGDAFQMDRIYYPKLEKSKYFKKLMDIYELTIQKVDRIVFVAEGPRNLFLQLNPSINSNKVFYIHNGIPNMKVEEHQSLNQPIEICCVGSIADRKGQQFIVDAIMKLSIEEREKIHFTLIGDGMMRTDLENKVRDANIQKYISFMGTRSDVDVFLKKSDIFILPSKDEGLPMAIIEAMRASLPIISTPVGGIPEMLKDGYNGLIMNPDEGSLYNILKNIENYDWLLMGRNSRKLFESKFSSNEMIKNYAKILTF